MYTFKESLIWQKLEGYLIENNMPNALNAFSHMINKSVELLGLVRDTFPTYTLHNHLHSENVISCIENLILRDIDILSPMECIIVLSTAYYHDIGMVYTLKEKEDLQDSDDFINFLSLSPEQNLEFITTGVISDSLLQSFCRWNHARHSYDYVMSQNEDDFLWTNNVSYKTAVANICLSHGMNADYLHDAKFDTNFFYQADLRFCALLLRLGDILDFDSRRSPKEVYKYLGLTNSDEKLKKISDIEWRKHLCSDGFIYLYQENKLGIIAAPTNPAVQYDLLQFIDMIEDELLLSSNMLKSCSASKQAVVIPQKIDRSKIVARGYIYGEYKFSISNNNLINLFMGKNLYSDRYSFIRELLQNSIDACLRHCAITSSDIKEYSILINTYIDSDGYSHFKITDNGIGMDLNTITNFFLKIGASYYESADFKIEMMKCKDKAFVPISKFGIGILSCFLISKTVVISTRKTNQTYQLTMKEADGFYFIKEIKNSNEFQHGTEIDILIDPGKETVNFNYYDYINKLSTFSKIKVVFNNQEIEQGHESILNKWSEYKKIDFTDKLERIKQRLFVSNIASSYAYLVIIPIDLTKYSISSNMIGQGIHCYLDIDNYEALIRTETPYENRKIELVFEHDKFFLNIRYHKDQEALLNDKKELIMKINTLISKQMTDKDKSAEVNYFIINEFNIYTAGNQGIEGIDEYIMSYKQLEDYEKNVDWNSEVSEKIDLYTLPKSTRDVIHLVTRKKTGLLSHNGISIPCRNMAVMNKTMFSMFAIALEGNMRPSVDLSREKITDFPIHFLMQFNIAVSRNLKESGNSSLYHIMPFQSLVMQDRPVLTKEIIEYLFEWKKEPMFSSDGIIMSFNAIRKKQVIDPQCILNVRDYANPEIDLIKYVNTITLDQSGCLYYDFGKNQYYVHKKEKYCYDVGRSFFPPLLFCKYKNSGILKAYNKPCNIDHPFSKWLILHAGYIQGKYPSILKQIYQALLETNEVRILRGINDILKRLQPIDGVLKINEDIFLKNNDFGISPMELKLNKNKHLF